MNLEELQKVIGASGGGDNAMAYASALLDKLNLVESKASLTGMLDQFRSAREAGDLRGRVLEVQFAHAFLTHNIVLAHAAKQDQAGDIDFRWDSEVGRIFFELKLLGEQQVIQEEEKSQLAQSNFFAHTVDDRIDVGRLQRDIFAKSSVTKFNPNVMAGDVNLLGIDASELQLGTVDVCDCVHAVCGAAGARGVFHEAMIRSEIVGALEAARELSPEEADWMKRFHPEKAPDPHPRSYIHGVVFLFRSPKERAALDYKLSCCVVWNSALIGRDVATAIESALYKILPKLSAPEAAAKT